MKKRPTSLLSSPRSLTAHQALAAAVIRQALVDEADPASSDRLRSNAQAFLAGSSMLRQWCLVAGLDLDCVEREYEAYRAVWPPQTLSSPAARESAPPKPLALPRPPFVRLAANVRQQSSRVRTLPESAVHVGR